MRASAGKSEVETSLGNGLGILREHPVKDNTLKINNNTIEMTDLDLGMLHTSPKFKDIDYSIPYMSKRLKGLAGITQRSFS